MAGRSEKSLQLYEVMKRMGYPPEFCAVVSGELRTDFTAGRMLGYLSHYKKPSFEEIADEMLAILADRDKYRDKAINEYTQSKLNYMMWTGFDDEE